MSRGPVALAPRRAGWCLPLCSRRYSAFSRIHSSAFTRASASSRMYWAEQSHTQLSAANTLPHRRAGQGRASDPRATGSLLGASQRRLSPPPLPRPGAGAGPHTGPRAQERGRPEWADVGSRGHVAARGCPAPGTACGTAARGRDRAEFRGAHPVNLHVVDAAEVQLAVPTRTAYGEAQGHSVCVGFC